MIKKSLIILLGAIFITTNFVKADEGMWIPLFLKKYNIEQMKKKGFKLTAEDIYDVNKASMKDAVMIFGGGCTAELISDKGLILTNHHCGYSAIQAHSSLEHDYLTDGFWAKTNAEELVNPSLTVTFLDRMEDVTTQVLAGIDENMTEKQRAAIVEKNIGGIVEKASEKGKFKAEVEPFFYGNQYFLFVQTVFKDVRLVGTPPSSIGKFGGDTDNWMWPRHTGDFSIFRIYADKNNNPATYSPDNVPYKPKKFFPVSLKGVKKGDFTMVFGYPGNTQEYIPSYAVKMISETQNPRRIAVRQAKIDIIGADMEADRGVRIQYSAKYAGISNAWKKWIGENRGLKRLNAIEKKQKYEQKFMEWVKMEDTRQLQYANLLPKYEEVYKNLSPYTIAEDYFFEAVWRLELVQFAHKASNLTASSDFEKDKEKLRKHADGFFKDYNIGTDKKLFRKMVEMYVTGAGAGFQPDFLKSISTDESTLKTALDTFTDNLFKNSVFVDKTKLDTFLTGLSQDDMSALLTDPVYKFYKDFLVMYVSKIRPVTTGSEATIDSLNRIYMRAQMEMDSEKNFYPDANFTLRVTYGQVADYEPADGIIYKHYTTLDGIIAKDNPEIYDYDVPDRLKELHKAKDYGDYAENGEMHVCFTGSNHTTGGNSGSPVINGKGELIGINFDRNWEGTMSDIMYDPNQCRNITLDIRYVLFIIDKLADCDRLINEMQIIRK